MRKLAGCAVAAGLNGMASIVWAAGGHFYLAALQGGIATLFALIAPAPGSEPLPATADPLILEALRELDAEFPADRPEMTERELAAKIQEVSRKAAADPCWCCPPEQLAQMQNALAVPQSRVTAENQRNVVNDPEYMRLRAIAAQGVSWAEHLAAEKATRN